MLPFTKGLVQCLLCTKDSGGAPGSFWDYKHSGFFLVFPSNEIKMLLTAIPILYICPRIQPYVSWSLMRGAMWGAGNCSLGLSRCMEAVVAPGQLQGAQTRLRTFCLSRPLSKVCFLLELVPVPLSHYHQEE